MNRVITPSSPWALITKKDLKQGNKALQLHVISLLFAFVCVQENVKRHLIKHLHMVDTLLNLSIRHESYNVEIILHNSLFNRRSIAETDQKEDHKNFIIWRHGNDVGRRPGGGQSARRYSYCLMNRLMMQGLVTYHCARAIRHYAIRTLW